MELDVETMRLRIRGAKEALDEARVTPQDTEREREGLDRLMALHRRHVVAAQRDLTEVCEEYAGEAHSPRHDVCEETIALRDTCEKNLMKYMDSLADSIERAEVSARTGRLPSPKKIDTDDLLV
jgi:hypothetical protein